MPHPRDGHLTDFVFCERGRRLGRHRPAQGLNNAVADSGLSDRAGRPLHVTLHQLRHTFGTSLVNAGMSLPALMALLGHVTPEMTLRYAKLASPTIRDAYETAMTKVKGRRPLFVIPAGATTAIPAKVDWLHTEMLKTRVAHGFCSRDPVAGACSYANICEQCDNYVPDPERHEVLPVNAHQMHPAPLLAATDHRFGHRLLGPRWCSEITRRTPVRPRARTERNSSALSVLSSLRPRPFPTKRAEEGLPVTFTKFDVTDLLDAIRAGRDPA